MLWQSTVNDNTAYAQRSWHVANGNNSSSSSCRRGEPISHSALVLALYRPVCVAFNLVAAVQLWKRGQLLVHQLLPQIQTEIVQKFSSLRQQSGRLVLNPEGRSKLQQVEQSPALLTTFLCHLPRFAIPFPFWQNDTRSVCLRVCAVGVKTCLQLCVGCSFEYFSCLCGCIYFWVLGRHGEGMKAEEAVKEGRGWETMGFGRGHSKQASCQCLCHRKFCFHMWLTSSS